MFILFLFGCVSLAAKQDEGSVLVTGSAQALITKILAEYIEPINKGQISSEQEKITFKSAIKDFFAVEKICQTIWREEWPSFSEQEKKKCVEFFLQGVTDVFLPKFQDFKGSKITIGKVENMSRVSKVEMVVEKSGASTYEISWVISKIDGNFLVLDITVEGTQMISVVKDEFYEKFKKILKEEKK